jgi:hypothetical protein
MSIFFSSSTDVLAQNTKTAYNRVGTYWHHSSYCNQQSFIDEPEESL